MKNSSGSFLGIIIPFVISQFLVMIGHTLEGWKGVFTMLAGLVSEIAMLYFYNIKSR